MVRCHIIYPVLAAFFLSLLAGCAGRGKENAVTHPFPSVQLPSIYADDREGALEYIAEHYWDNFTDTSETYLCDTAVVNGVRKDDVEQAFADFTGVLQSVVFQQAEKAMEILFERISAFEDADTSSNVLETVMSFAEKYLYDPNSPVRNEDLYGVLAGRLSEYPGIPAEKRDVYAYDARMCALNSVGTRASDFVFSDAKGRSYSLYDIDAEYILLFFSNPGCHACEEIIKTLADGLAVSSLIESGRLAVVNVYIDEDLSAWYEYMPVYPDDWYNGYDPNGIIRADTLYNVRAIPSLYILDRDKTVIMKDAPDRRVFAFLSDLAQGGIQS